MWFKIVNLVTIFSVVQCGNVIYHINDTEYERMPPIYMEDARKGCSPYCAVKMEVFQDTPSDLYRMMIEYSEHTVKHFNYSKLSYGVCVPKRCPQYKANTSVDLIESLEACLNVSMMRNYGLQAKITSHHCDKDLQLNIDASDVIVAAVCLAFILLTVAGTVQEIVMFIDIKRKGNAILECFSLPRNIKRLFNVPAVITEENRSFKVFYGIRFMLIFQVIGYHSYLPYFVKAKEARLTEQAYSVLQYLSTGNLLIQGLFVVSGLLMSYTLHVKAEKSKLGFTAVAKGILLRWIRLTLPYAIVLGIISTWLRYLEPYSGPTWQWTMGQTISDCRRDWWMALLQMINFVDESMCLPETWFIATDMQLFIIVLVVLVLVPERWRYFLLMSLFVTSLATLGFITYFLDLDATVIMAPETNRNVIVHDKTFNYVYQRTYTNMCSYIIGVGSGILVYRIQKSGVKMDQYKKYGFLVWLCIAVFVPIILGGSVFYADGPRVPIYVRVAYAILHKPIAALLAAIIIIGTVFELENFVGRILGWRLWVTPARLSYSAYLVHVTIISIATSFNSTGFQYHDLNISVFIIIMEVISFLTAVPLWLLVEAPVSKLVRLLTASPQVVEKNKTEILSSRYE